MMSKNARYPHARYRLRWVDDEEVIEGNLHSDEVIARSCMRQIQEGTLFHQGLILEERCCDCGMWTQVDSLWSIMIRNDGDEISQRVDYEHEMLRSNLLVSTS